MAELVHEGECCECCLLMIANGDDSGCRDYYNHDHPGPMPEKIAEGYAIASSWPPAFGEDDWSEEDIALGLDRESRLGIGPCELCGQGNSYMDLYPYAIIR